MNITWIASYPKSGNTWVRFMLYAALYGPPERSIDVSAKIPDIHRPLPTDPDPDSDATRLVKTHFELTDEHPLLDQTSGAIHIIRDPRDVLLSAINYQRLKGDSWVSKKQYAKAFIAQRGDPHWRSMGFGSWSSNAHSWRETDRFPVLALRYEDLKADPARALRDMLGFIGAPIDEARIERAVAASAFDTMRAMEQREKDADPDPSDDRLFVGDRAATRDGVYFMNKGRSGQSLTAIGPGFDSLLSRAFADDLESFGYPSRPSPDR